MAKPTELTNTRNTSIETLEWAFPLLVLRQRLRRGSGGAGSAPGGEGIERDLQVLEDATLSLITERRVSQRWGLAGPRDAEHPVPRLVLFMRARPVAADR